MNPWWSQHAAALIGGLGGGGVGILGALLGTLMGTLAPRGIGKGLVIGLQCVLLGIGVVTAVTGLTAMVLGQPYHVWYPLVLIGFVLGGVCGGLLPATRHVYRQAEARRLDAEQMRREGAMPLDELAPDR